MIKKIKNLVGSIYQIHHETLMSNYQQSEFLIRSILKQSKYQDPLNVSRYSMKFFSQFGEDGLINEIFRRVGITNKFFVEFGVGNGLENNTCFQLAVNRWQGLWIEGSEASCDFIKQKFHRYIAQDKLKLRNQFITAENIQSLFVEAGVPVEFDLLSIDIDGNDYYVWKAISEYSPRVVVIEYNGSFGPYAENVIPYSPTREWDGTNQFGSSLKSFELLGKEKGYELVACDIAGINAFFVRKDLLRDKFQAPFSSEFHYEPPRYYLKYFGGHPQNV